MGGNVFENTAGIDINNIEPTVNQYFKELHKIFPLKKDVLNKDHFKYIGSVGKKEISGDIDFAIDISTIIDKDFSDDRLKEWGLNPEDVINQFTIFKKRARTATDNELMMRSILKGIADKINNESNDLIVDPKKVGMGNVFSSYPQYNSKQEKLNYNVQIDWMVGNLEWLEFSYYSDVYKENVKGLHRTQLILSMFQNLNLSFNHIKGVTDKETGEILATNPKSAIELLEDCYNIRLPKYIINNYFELIKVVNSLKQTDRDGIIDVYLKILDSTRADIPKNLQMEWLHRRDRLNLKGKFLPDDSLIWKML